MTQTMTGNGLQNDLQNAFRQRKVVGQWRIALLTAALFSTKVAGHRWAQGRP
jgi:hypothetical protein